MAYQTRWDNDSFFAEFSGEVPSREIETVNAEFTGDPRFDTVHCAVWDMTGIIRLTMSAADVETAAATDWGASAIRRHLRGAIVVPEGHVRELVEQYLVLSGGLENPWETRLFGDIDSARRWLGI